MERLKTQVGEGVLVVKKNRGKPYYSCRIHSARACRKSTPVAHLKCGNIDELIETKGLKNYYKLIEKDWGEAFYYSTSEVKTH